jgi:hypothetical protein
MEAPGKILATLLDQEGLASFASGGSNSGSVFGLSTGKFPQNDGVDRWILLTDYGVMIGGRLMKTGQYEEHPRIQVRVRSTDYDEAYRKISAIKKFLLEDDDGDGIVGRLPLEITVNGEDYLLKNVSWVNGPLFMGVEEKNRRVSFSLNLQVTFGSE